MYIYRNTETRSLKICCREKARNTGIIHSEIVFVALGIQHEMRIRRIVIYGLSGSTIFFHIIS